MKLICLNTWGGRAGLSGLKNFFRKHQDTDIFCLQEIWQTTDPSLIETRDLPIVTDLLEQIAAELPEHKYYFRPQYRGVYGLATFVRKDMTVLDEGEVFVFKTQGYENPVAIGNHGRNIQHLTLKLSNGPLTIVNFHGLWNGEGKSDSNDRILQSEIIARFLKGLKNPVVLAGDFNLTPNTQSFKILNEVCPKNLILDNNITSTRSSFYTKPEKMADYILTSPQVSVTHFEVMPDEVSDHLGLKAEFSV